MTTDMTVYAIRCDGELVTTERASIAKAWKEGGIEVIELSTTARHLEELNAADITICNREARIAELEEKLAAPLVGQQEVQPAFYAVIGESGGALPQYAANTEEGVIHNVLAVARNEGYKGDGISRLIELGWKVRPVYTHPTQQVLAALKLARARLADMLEGDDGQAWKEARKAIPIIDAAIAAQAKQGGV